MKVYLTKDIEKVGLKGEIISVPDGFGRNFLFPRKLAVEVTPENESLFVRKQKIVENRKEVVATKTSMLAEKIKSLALVLRRKMHDDGKLYAAINASEIVDLLAEKGIAIAKNQVEFDKSIKDQGMHYITIKLSSKLKPVLTLKVVSE
jgi:large subunit ribosomal protein L9